MGCCWPVYRYLYPYHDIENTGTYNWKHTWNHTISCSITVACTLIASYFRENKQRIKLGSSRSEWTELFKGVPQVSILGPLIFNIFLNDIFYFVSKGDRYNYADDKCIRVSHNDISVVSTQLENETQVMTKWFADNSMKVPRYYTIRGSKWYSYSGFTRWCGHCICTEDWLSRCVYWWKTKFQWTCLPHLFKGQCPNLCPTTFDGTSGLFKQKSHIYTF